ncbi:MAG: hypothetical protein COX63_01235 [Candidatus Diapherotrites archaeon CG_4_10_14_0_2_um_filter_31_5]|nr:MAG: hypothetical protein COX63_01235 [Candidatus Diapherotrites archaeon CG_4_10_14_0_2_um_filter_31_5]
MPKKKVKKTSKKKTVKKTTAKKRTVKKTAPAKTSAEFLSSALKEIEQQLGALQGQKKGMERDLYLLALDFNDTQNEENQLRDKISKLVERESHLNTKKTKLKSEMQSLQEKITKVTQINAEMKGMT